MTNIEVVRLVVRILGILSILLVCITGVLAWRIVGEDSITAEAVGVLTAVVGLAGTSIGAVGSLLVSTRSDPPPGEP